MFIRIPGTVHEGDNAEAATAHPTLDAALGDLTELGTSETVTVLDTGRIPLGVAAYACCHATRSAADQHATAHRGQIVAGRRGTVVLVK